MTAHDLALADMTERGRRARRMSVRLAGRNYVRSVHLKYAGHPFLAPPGMKALLKDWTVDDLPTCRAVATILCEKIRRCERAGNRSRADLLRSFLAGELNRYRQLRVRALFGEVA